MTSPCAIRTPDSPFLILKRTSTIMTPSRNRSASPMADFSFQKSLLTRSAAHRTPAQSLEKSPSARRCNQWRSSVSTKTASLPALHQPGVGTVPGPDVIVGELLDFVQMENGAVNGEVGLALGTDA